MYNDGPESILVSSDLGLNVSKYGLRELNFVFTDDQGREYFSKNEVRAASSGNAILLEAGHFFGRRIELAGLVPMFRLNPGDYKLRAVYCKQKSCSNINNDIYTKEILSKEIEISIPTNFGVGTIPGIRAPQK